MIVNDFICLNSSGGIWKKNMAKSGCQNLRKCEVRKIYNFVTNLDHEIENIAAERLVMSESGLVYHFKHIFGNAKVYDVLSGTDMSTFEIIFDAEITEKNTLERNDDSLSEFEVQFSNGDPTPRSREINEKDVYVREHFLENIVNSFVIGNKTAKKITSAQPTLFRWTEKIPTMRKTFGVKIKNQNDSEFMNMESTEGFELYSHFLNLRETLVFIRQELLQALALQSTEVETPKSSSYSRVRKGAPQHDTSSAPRLSKFKRSSSTFSTKLTELLSAEKYHFNGPISLPEKPTFDEIELYLHYLFDKVDKLSTEVKGMHFTLEQQVAATPTVNQAFLLKTCVPTSSTSSSSSSHQAGSSSSSSYAGGTDSEGSNSFLTSYTDIYRSNLSEMEPQQEFSPMMLECNDSTSSDDASSAPTVSDLFASDQDNVCVDESSMPLNQRQSFPAPVSTTNSGSSGDAHNIPSVESAGNVDFSSPTSVCPQQAFPLKRDVSTSTGDLGESPALGSLFPSDSVNFHLNVMDTLSPQGKSSIKRKPKGAEDPKNKTSVPLITTGYVPTNVPTLGGLLPRCPDDFRLVVSKLRASRKYAKRKESKSSLQKAEKLKKKGITSDSEQKNSEERTINMDTSSTAPWSVEQENDEPSTFASFCFDMRSDAPIVSDEGATESSNSHPSSDSPPCDYSVTSIEVTLDEMDAKITNLQTKRICCYRRQALPSADTPNSADDEEEFCALLNTDSDSRLMA